MKLIGILILLIFYTVYLGKMIMQRRKGIRTDQIARGRHRDKVYYTELVLKIATYSVVLVEVASIFVARPKLPLFVIILGFLLGIAGDVIFTVAVATMKDSWRAGLAAEDKTEMVTRGIYQISRNPAFLGFDCVYLGMLCLFFNWVLLFFSVFAISMLHLQILQEEKYLVEVFDKEYLEYKHKVCRYIGRRRTNNTGSDDRNGAL